MLLQFAKGIGINHFISNERGMHRHTIANAGGRQNAAHLVRIRGAPKEVAYIKQKPALGDSKRRGDIALTAGGERPPLRKPVAIPPMFYSGINKMLQAMSHDNANKDTILNENSNFMGVNNPLNPLNPLIESMRSGKLMNQLAGMRRSPASPSPTVVKNGIRKDSVNAFAENSTN